MMYAQNSGGTGILSRVRPFLQKPWREKANSLRVRWTRATSSLKLPVRLPFGAWWIQRDDNLTQPLMEGRFETSEMAFVERFLHPGMNVLDIGAHQGLYTLLSSRCVGSKGKVIAFEPSPRERQALRLHVCLNFCTNVTIQALAIANEESECDLYVVKGTQTGCNSLRPPDVMSETFPVRVHVSRLDDWMNQQTIDSVDFIKLDVEGAELHVLKGAQQLLDCRPRPIILVEVQDVRTSPWGYQAKEIIHYLSGKGFRWFVPCENGTLEELDTKLEAYEGNFVAWPGEVEPTMRLVQTGMNARCGRR